MECTGEGNHGRPGVVMVLFMEEAIGLQRWKSSWCYGIVHGRGNRVAVAEIDIVQKSQFFCYVQSCILSSITQQYGTTQINWYASLYLKSFFSDTLSVQCMVLFLDTFMAMPS